MDGLFLETNVAMNLNISVDFATRNSSMTMAIAGDFVVLDGGFSNGAYCQSDGWHISQGFDKF